MKVDLEIKYLAVLLGLIWVIYACLLVAGADVGVFETLVVSFTSGFLGYVAHDYAPPKK